MPGRHGVRAGLGKLIEYRKGANESTRAPAHNIGANQAIQFPLAQIKAKTELGRLMDNVAVFVKEGSPGSGLLGPVAGITWITAGREAVCSESSSPAAKPKTTSGKRR